MKSVYAALALAWIAVPLACSSFDDAEQAGATDAGPEEAGPLAPDAAPSDDAAIDDDAGSSRRSGYLFVFGGVSDAALTTPASEAYRAAIAADGSLGPWERFARFDLSMPGAAFATTSAGRLVATSGDTKTARLLAATGWANGPSLVEAHAYGGVAASKETVFLTGGHRSGALSSDVYVSTFSGDVLPSWAAAGTMPAGRAEHAAVVLGSRLYAIGGLVETVDVTATAETITTTFDGDGGVMPGWQGAGTLPAPVSGLSAVTAALRIIAVGGADAAGTPAASVSVGTPSEAGAITWTATSPLPAAAYLPCVAADGRTLYVVGGVPSKDGAPHAAVAIGEMDLSGNVTWKTSADLPAPRAGAGCAVR